LNDKKDYHELKPTKTRTKTPIRKAGKGAKTADNGEKKVTAASDTSTQYEQSNNKGDKKGQKTKPPPNYGITKSNCQNQRQVHSTTPYRKPLKADQQPLYPQSVKRGQKYSLNRFLEIKFSTFTNYHLHYFLLQVFRLWRKSKSSTTQQRKQAV